MVGFVELDERLPFAHQLRDDEGPIVFFNTFHVAPDEVDSAVASPPIFAQVAVPGICGD